MTNKEYKNMNFANNDLADIAKTACSMGLSVWVYKTDVYPNEPFKSLFFAEKSVVGGAESGYFGEMKFSTNHTANRESGTGFVFENDASTKEMIHKALRGRPNWASHYKVTKIDMAGVMELYRFNYFLVSLSDSINKDDAPFIFRPLVPLRPDHYREIDACFKTHVHNTLINGSQEDITTEFRKGKFLCSYTEHGITYKHIVLRDHCPVCCDGRCVRCGAYNGFRFVKI